ncbi:hypothetical protein D9619_009166 [Psilocybe cf. subviscida]|uniref:Uncharacterized protein n=1 Tax=Psilocybe cf. subviscida TaxID=2480587 RepID=A0A8H5BUW1_9AGAR|nr:hypothetical protein D9619_009166 [Psilocybe cf. subviscida]
MPRATNSDASYKKTKVVTDRPATTQHDINDQYFKDPPQNVDKSMNKHKVEYPAGVKLVDDLDEILESGEQADGLGREKREVRLGDIARDDAVHS